MKKIEEYAVYSLVLLAGMTVGWAICYVGLGIMGVL